MNVGDVNLGLLANLDASFEGRRTLCGEDAARAAVEHAKPQRRVAGRLARPVETVVVLPVAARQLGAALAQHRAELGVVARAGDAKLELRLDGAVSRGAQPATRHAASVTVTRRSFATGRERRSPRCIRLR